MAQDSSMAVPTNSSKAAICSDPVGNGAYVVKMGDCIASIAFDNGHFWKTIWDDPANQELKTARKNPYILFAGDRVKIPALRPRVENGSTERKHRFRRRGVPETLRIRLLDSKGRPRANEPYEIEINGRRQKGKTDAGGHLSESIPPNAKSGTLALGNNGEKQPLRLGHMDPIETVTGVQSRLNNLQFHCGPVDGALGPATEAALRLFQGICDLEPSGTPDKATLSKLQERYGC